VAREEASESSDVDFLVELDPGRSVFDLGGLSADLEALLGRRVDIAEVNGLSPHLRETVLREAIPL
jgi:predicted nucleotidyltransferase